MAVHYRPVAPNLLPVDPATGGQASLVGWHQPDGTLTPAGFTLPKDTAITTADVRGGVAAVTRHIAQGATYGAGITACDFVAVTILWIGPDGTLTVGPTEAGTGRVFCAGPAPAGAAGMVVEISAPTARIVTTGASSAQVTYSSRAARRGSFNADTTPTEQPAALSGAVLVQSAADPGTLDPAPVDETFGRRAYNDLPGYYRADDISGQLLAWLKGVGQPADDTLTAAGQVLTGGLSDPSVAPDSWLPWIAQAAGIIPQTSADATRALLAQKAAAPYPGTRAALAGVAQRWLTGTQVCSVYPGPNPWEIVIRVRADQIDPSVSTLAGLAAAVTATGQVPAGRYVICVAGQPTWAQVDALGPTWAGIDRNRTWSKVDSTGVTGA